MSTLAMKYALDALNDRQRKALMRLAKNAVKFASTMAEQGEAWDTETDVLSAAVEFAETLTERARARIEDT